MPRSASGAIRSGWRTCRGLPSPAADATHPAHNQNTPEPKIAGSGVSDVLRHHRPPCEPSSTHRGFAVCAAPTLSGVTAWEPDTGDDHLTCRCATNPPQRITLNPPQRLRTPAWTSHLGGVPRCGTAYYAPLPAESILWGTNTSPRPSQGGLPIMLGRFGCPASAALHTGHSDPPQMARE